MTSLYATKLPNGAGIGVLSDGAIVDMSTGILEAVSAKVWCRPDRRFLVARHGHPHTDETSAYLDKLASLLTFDHAIDQVNYDLAVNLIAGHPEDNWKTFTIGILIAGYSDFHGGWRMAYANFSNYPKQPVAPWSLTDAGDEWSRGPSMSVEEMRPILAGLTVLDEAGLYDRGADLFEAQRRKPIEAPGFPPYFGVGGFVDLTIVEDAGSRQARLRDWPDKIGRPINP